MMHAWHIIRIQHRLLFGQAVDGTEHPRTNHSDSKVPQGKLLLCTPHLHFPTSLAWYSRLPHPRHCVCR